ncbi:hypothetical protein D3C80_1703270 [compost metagenome]
MRQPVGFAEEDGQQHQPQRQAGPPRGTAGTAQLRDQQQEGDAEAGGEKAQHRVEDQRLLGNAVAGTPDHGHQQQEQVAALQQANGQGAAEGMHGGLRLSGRLSRIVHCSARRDNPARIHNTCSP